MGLKLMRMMYFMFTILTVALGKTGPTNLIELPLAAHRYIHNKGSFEALTADQRYSSFHLNLIKLLKEMCQGNETRPLSYFIDNALI